MTLVPTPEPTVSLQELKEWIMRFKPVICRFQPQPEPVDPTNEQYYISLIQLLTTRRVVRAIQFLQCNMNLHATLVCCGWLDPTIRRSGKQRIGLPSQQSNPLGRGFPCNRYSRNAQTSSSRTLRTPKQCTGIGSITTTAA
jgi:hypothetical protein